MRVLDAVTTGCAGRPGKSALGPGRVGVVNPPIWNGGRSSKEPRDVQVQWEQGGDR